MRGVLRLKISQKNCGYYFEKLRSKGAKIFNIIPLDNSVTFCINAKAAVMAQKFLDDEAVVYEVVSDSRLNQRLKNTARHITLIIGGMCIVAIFAILSKFCFEVEVRCENIEIAKQVEYIVRQDKVVGKIKSQVDNKALEKKIAEQLPQVAFVQIYFGGSTVCIDVVCQKDAVIKEKNYTKIVASEDAVISRVLCYSGTPVVKEGDSVKKGQTLIEGYIEIGNKDDANNYQKVEVAARGEIFARVWQEESLSLSQTTIIFERTGKAQTFYETIIFGKEIKSSRKTDFSYFELEKKQVFIGGIIPLAVNVYTYHELAENVVGLDEVYIEQKIFEAKSKIVSRLLEDEKVCLDWKIEKKLDNLLQIDIYYEVEKLIAVGVFE